MQAARLLKSKNPHSMVEVKDLRSGDVTAVGNRAHLSDLRRSRQSALALVHERQRSDDTIGPRGNSGGGQGAVSEELGCLEGMGKAGRGAMTRIEQRGAVAFTCMAAAVVVILLITLWGYLF
jgi:hypothetical protein